MPWKRAVLLRGGGTCKIRRVSLARVLESMGRGFLGDDRNGALRRAIASGELEPRVFLREIEVHVLRLALESVLGDATAVPWRSYLHSSDAAPHLDASAISAEALAATREQALGVLAATLEGDGAIDLGAAHESMLGLSARVDPCARSIVCSRDRAGRRMSGSFYTPSAVVERLLDLVIEPLCDEVIARSGSGRAERELFGLRVLDPACGTGSILRVAARRIARRIEAEARAIEADPSPIGAAPASDTLARVIAATIRGTDADPIAVEICKVNLWLDAKKPTLRPGLFDEHIRCIDALEDDETRATTADTRAHAVITNPPWASCSGRQRARIDERAVARWIARDPALRAWPATHTAFLLAAPRALVNGGRFGLVLPLAVAHLERYRPVREEIERATSGDVRVVDCGERAFPGVVQPTGLFTGRVASATEHTRAATWLPKARRELASVGDLVSHLARFPKFDGACFSDPGVHTGNMASSIVRAGHVGRDGWEPLREGKDVDAYVARAPRRLVLAHPHPAAGEYCRVPDRTRLLRFPILVRQTARRPIAARHHDPCRFRNSLLACAGVAGVAHEVMLAVLNSCLIGAWHRSQTLDAAQRAFPQVKVSHLRALPAFERERLDTRDEAGVALEQRLIGHVREIEELNARADRTQRAADARDLDLRRRIELCVAELYRIPREWIELTWIAEHAGEPLQVGSPGMHS